MAPAPASRAGSPTPLAQPLPWVSAATTMPTSVRAGLGPVPAFFTVTETLSTAVPVRQAPPRDMEALWIIRSGLGTVTIGAGLMSVGAGARGAAPARPGANRQSVVASAADQRPARAAR